MSIATTHLEGVMSGKRVRREIRDLSPRDWNAVVAAMWIMKNTGDSDGKKKYGAFFVSYDTMVAKHMSAALDPAGDQAHFGAIFPIFHRAWLLELENSLRAIDSKIEALPYWDLNRDLSPLRGQYKSIFSNDYMGSLIGQAPDYAIMDGKFAKWKISTNSKRALQNAFGYLRHPLSPNKCPYVTRNGGTICGTQFGLGDSSMWNTCFQVGDNIMSWSSCVDSRIHGPAHTFIAGSWRRDGQQVDSRNCAQWFGFIGAPSTSKVPVGTNFKTITMNELYRFGSFISPVGLGCFSCPRCDKSRNPNDCMCKPQPFCGPLWTKLRVATSLRPDSRFIDTSSMSELAPASGIQILGDLGDPSGSANDPL